jgi:hypothetical protein
MTDARRASLPRGGGMTIVESPMAMRFYEPHHGDGGANLKNTAPSLSRL